MQGRIQDFGFGGALVRGSGDGTPPAGPGQSSGGSGGEASEARRMLRHEAEETTLYDNIIISSTHHVKKLLGALGWARAPCVPP